MTTTDVVYFYEDGICYHGSWRQYPSLDLLEDEINRPVQLSISGQPLVVEPGWGLYQWQRDTLYVEQLTSATRGRFRVQTWKALMHGDTLQKIFPEESTFVTLGLPECLKHYDFRPSERKPNPERLFEQDKKFIRSQKYYMERARKRELRRSKP